MLVEPVVAGQVPSLVEVSGTISDINGEVIRGAKVNLRRQGETRE